MAPVRLPVAADVFAGGSQYPHDCHAHWPCNMHSSRVAIMTQVVTGTEPAAWRVPASAWAHTPASAMKHRAEMENAGGAAQRGARIALKLAGEGPTPTVARLVFTKARNELHISRSADQKHLHISRSALHLWRMSSDAASPAPAAEAPADDVIGEEGEEYDASTRRAVQRIPLLSVRAGPRDGAPWRERLKEEYKALITLIRMNKENDNDWFVLAADEAGVRYAACAAPCSLALLVRLRPFLPQVGG